VKHLFCISVMNSPFGGAGAFAAAAHGHDVETS
jgi:hypothetical protein